MKHLLKVSTPPEKPTMTFDGECGFCRFWVRHWHRRTRDRIDYLPYQDPDVRRRFSEIPKQQLEKSVQLIDRNGLVFSGAEAVFRALAKKPDKSWLLWCYKKIPGFGLASELAYRLVSLNRPLFAFFNRLFLGHKAERQSKPLHRQFYEKG